jgi:hypothetical protein
MLDDDALMLFAERFHTGETPLAAEKQP